MSKLILPMLISPMVFAQKHMKADLPVGNAAPRYYVASVQETYKIELAQPENISRTVKQGFLFNSYDLKDEGSKKKLISDIDKLLDVYKESKGRDHVEFDISGDIKQALKYLKQQAEALLTMTTLQPEFHTIAERIFEVSDSINLNYKGSENIVFPKIELSQLLSIVLGSNNSRLGQNPLSLPNTLKTGVNEDPADSTFWQKPKDVSNQEMIISFGREKLPDYSKTVFKYDKPKTGYGMHAGFRVKDFSETKKNKKSDDKKDEGQEYKLRLGAEARISPFESRILQALGFNSLPIDYVPVMRVAYERNIFKEYNSRKPIPLKVSWWGLNLFTYKLSPFKNPFDEISKVILKNGEEMNAEAFKAKLIPGHRKLNKSIMTNDESYDKSFEDTVAEVQFKHASLEKLDDDMMSVGPWDWNATRHTYHKELRGYGLLAAWLGQFDARVDNTRLYLVKTKGDKKEDGTREEGKIVLRHFVSDVGSGLGKSNPMFSMSVDDLKNFRDEVVKARHNGQMISTKFRTYTMNKCFEATNVDDAEWMYKYINALTEQQIKDAAKVSGFSETEAQEVYDKLMTRKQNIRTIIDVIKSK